MNVIGRGNYGWIKNFRKRNGFSELKYISVLEYREATDYKRTKTRIHHHINDYKYSNKKLYELSQNQWEREVFEKLYPWFIYTGHDVVFNDVDGGIYVYIKMRRLE